MVLDREIKIQNFADQDVQTELNKTVTPFNEKLREVFGMEISNPYTAKAEPFSSELTPELITELINEGLKTLKSQKAKLSDAGKVTEATEVDVHFGQGEVIITDFERALEFLDKDNVRTNPDSFRKVWEYIVREATKNVEMLSPMKNRMPSLVLPRGLKFPIFGRYERGVWSDQREFLTKMTLRRIEEVNQFVQTNWLKMQDKTRQSA